MKSITIRQPDDFHLHLRDGKILQMVLPSTARIFGRALVMPNLQYPVITMDDALFYKQRILSYLGKKYDFIPLMTLYLTEETDYRDVARAISRNVIKAVKLYPAGATTNSKYGINNYDRIDNVLALLSETGVPLCIHGEDPDPHLDIFDREVAFLNGILDTIRSKHPQLRIVLEHITTADAIAYVRANYPSVAATITVHHLVINRNDILAGGIRPHYYCLPVAKREKHRLELINAVTSGEDCFFLGTDSAPHPRSSKEAHCGCAGIFTIPVALPVLTHVFEQAEALDNLERFVSINGAAFYGLKPNQGWLTLEKNYIGVDIPDSIRAFDEEIVIFDPGHKMEWNYRNQ